MLQQKIKLNLLHTGDAFRISEEFSALGDKLVVITKRKAKDYRNLIVKKLLKHDEVIVESLGFYQNKIPLTLCNFLNNFKNKVAVEEITTDVRVSNNGKPFSIMRLKLKWKDKVKVEDGVILQVEETGWEYSDDDLDKLTKNGGWSIIAKKNAEKYRSAVLYRLYTEGIAKVLAIGKAINKLWLVLNAFVIARKDKVEVKQVQFDCWKNKKWDMPVGVMKVILMKK